MTTEQTELEALEADILTVRAKYHDALKMLKESREEVALLAPKLADMESARLKLLRAELRKASR